MQISKLPLRQIRSSAPQYAHLGEQLAGMSQPFHQEVIANEGQQLFTLQKPFTTGTNQLKVYVNGVLQSEGTAGGYVEVNSSTVLFNEPMHAGDVLVFRIEGAGSGFVTMPPEGGGLLTAAEVKTLYESNSDTNAFTDLEQAKLASVDWGANNYVHPSTHPAEMIVESSQRRFVTDEERARWDAGGIDYIPLNKAGDVVEGTLTVEGNLVVKQNILPDEDGERDLGSPTKRFKNLYVQEAHLSLDTLYIGSTPVLGTEETQINLQADPNQDIEIRTTGIGRTLISSEKQVRVETSDQASADITISAVGGNIHLIAGEGVSIDSPGVTLDGSLNITGAMMTGDLLVQGNASFQGTVFTVNTEEVNTSQTFITLNEGEAGAGVTAGQAGLLIDRGTLPRAKFAYNETEGFFEIGEEGSLQPIATRPWADGRFVPLVHMGANGTNHHALATQTMAGFMSPQDKAKLDNISPGANEYVHPLDKQCSYQYTHPIGDGNLHVPATGTSNAGKVLKAGSVAGSISWGNIEWVDITNRPGLATAQAPGLLSASDKAKLDTVSVGAAPNQNAFSAVRVGGVVLSAGNQSDVFELVAGSGVSLSVDAPNKRITVTASGGGGGGSVRKYRVAPAGNIDGENQVFVLPEDIIADSEEVFVNGLLMDKGPDKDYTISGRNITLSYAPPTESRVLVSYSPA